MSRPRPRRVLPLLTLLAGLAGGCAAPTPGLRLESLKDPYFPESFRLDLTDCAYWVDTGGDIHVAGRAGGGPGGEAVTQYLQIHIYWRPHPGKTPAESSMTDALLQYVVASPDGVAMYTGTGFAYPRKIRPGEPLPVDIEAGRLALTSRTGELPDVLGPTRVTGTLYALPDAGRAVALAREAQLAANR